MLEDIIQPKSESLSIEDISSPIAAQILDFCDDDTAGSGDLFHLSANQSNHHIFHSSDEVSSSSATTTVTASNTANTNTTATTGPNSPLRCYADDASFSPLPSLDAATLSALLNGDDPPPPDPEHDFLPGVPYPSSSASSSSRLPSAPPTTTFPVRTAYHQQDPFDQMALTDAFAGGYTPYCSDITIITMPGNQQQVVYEEECYTAAMQQTTGFLGLDASFGAPSPYGFLEGNGTGGMGSLYHQGGGGMGIGESAGFFDGGGMMAVRLDATGGLVGGHCDMAEYTRMQNSGLGLFGQDSMQRAYSSSDMQVIGRGNQHLITGCSNSASGPSAAEIPTVDDPTFKVGRLSVEERKEKIHRYMKKRNERNFSKKIKYACRKTLADSRPRVRGRFAKNDEFGEASRPSSSNHEFDDEEEVVVKEEDDMLESSDILAHISGLNSFKYNYTPNFGGYESNGMTDASLGYCPL